MAVVDRFPMRAIIFGCTNAIRRLRLAAGLGEVSVRDAGLERAIDAAGGVAQLARRIGIAQPSVSNWNRVPAQRVIAVESATGVSRRVLRPDLYSEPAVSDNVVDPTDAGRAQEY